MTRPTGPTHRPSSPCHVKLRKATPGPGTSWPCYKVARKTSAPPYFLREWRVTAPRILKLLQATLVLATSGCQSCLMIKSLRCCRATVSRKFADRPRGTENQEHTERQHASAALPTTRAATNKRDTICATYKQQVNTARTRQ